MAKSGVIYGSRAVNSTGPRLELHWSVTSQSVANNTSIIKVVSVLSMGGWVSYDLTTSGSTTAQGTTKTYSYTPTSATATTRTMATTYHTVTHDSDGALTLTLSGKHTLRNFTWSGSSVGTISASRSITLDQIIRGIKEDSVSLATGWNTVDGSKTVTFTKLSSTATVKLTWQYYNNLNGNWSDIRTVSTNYTSGTSFSFSAADNTTIHDFNPSNTSTSFRIKVEAYQGGTKVNTVARTTTLTLKAEVPTVSGTIKVVGDNQSLLGSSTRAVQGVHSVTITASGTAKNSATIKGYEITFQGVKYTKNPVTIPIIESGSLAVKIKAIDSRGYGLTRDVGTVTSIKYARPHLSGLKAARYEGTTESPTGDTWKVTGSVAFTTVTDANGESCNTPWWRFDSATTTYNSSIIQSGSLPIENTKTMTLYFGDSFTTASKMSVTIPRGEVPFAIGQKGIGVGTMPPENAVGLFIRGAIDFKATSNDSRVTTGSYDNLPNLFNTVSSSVTVNAPPGTPRWRYVLYFKYAYAGFQIAFPYSFASGQKIYARSKDDSEVWGDWYTLATLT